MDYFISCSNCLASKKLSIQNTAVYASMPFSHHDNSHLAYLLLVCMAASRLLLFSFKWHRWKLVCVLHPHKHNHTSDTHELCLLSSSFHLLHHVWMFHYMSIKALVWHRMHYKHTLRNIYLLFLLFSHGTFFLLIYMFFSNLFSSLTAALRVSLFCLPLRLFPPPDASVHWDIKNLVVFKSSFLRSGKIQNQGCKLNNGKAGQTCKLDWIYFKRQSRTHMEEREDTGKKRRYTCTTVNEHCEHFKASHGVLVRLNCCIFRNWQKKRNWLKVCKSSY